MKAESSRLIPRKLTANPELLLPWVLIQSRCSVYASALAVSHDPGYASSGGTATLLDKLQSVKKAQEKFW